MPLARFVAGFRFTSVTYLLTKDFHAILRGSFSSRKKKAFFVCLLFVSTLVTVFAAPAVVTALIPVSALGEARGTDVWFNNTEKQMLPDFVSDAETLGSICSASDDIDLCPSARWRSINDQLALLLPRAGKVVDDIIQSRAPRVLQVGERRSIIGIRSELGEPRYDR